MSRKGVGEGGQEKRDFGQQLKDSKEDTSIRLCSNNVIQYLVTKCMT